MTQELWTGRRIGTYQIRRCSARAGWAKCTARATRGSAATSRSRSCRRRFAQRSGSAGALRARSAAAGGAQSSEHRRRSTASKSRTASARWCSSSSRAKRLPTASTRGALPLARSARDRAPDRRRARRRARERHRPPRSKPANVKITPDGSGQGARLRPGESRRRRREASARSDQLADDHALDRTRDGRHPRHRRLHEPGAGARPGGRQADGHLGVRLRAVRNADRARRIRARHDLRHHRRGSRRHAGLVQIARRTRRRSFVVCFSGAWRKTHDGGFATSATSRSSSTISPRVQPPLNPLRWPGRRRCGQTTLPGRSPRCRWRLLSSGSRWLAPLWSAGDEDRSVVLTRHAARPRHSIGIRRGDLAGRKMGRVPVERAAGRPTSG